MAVIAVAAGVLMDAEGRVYITRRGAHQHQGGLWEFPGGKLEVDETARRALDRELFEELAIRVIDAQSYIQVDHDYGDVQIVLHVFTVSDYAGTPCGAEGQEGRWVALESLTAVGSSYAFPVANQPILDKLSAME
jgi:8-oxo-dGTP diphosphatase